MEKHAFEFDVEFNGEKFHLDDDGIVELIIKFLLLNSATPPHPAYEKSLTSMEVFLIKITYDIHRGAIHSPSPREWGVYLNWLEEYLVEYLTKNASNTIKMFEAQTIAVAKNTDKLDRGIKMIDYFEMNKENLLFITGRVVGILDVLKSISGFGVDGKFLHQIMRGEDTQLIRVILNSPPNEVEMRVKERRI